MPPCQPSLARRALMAAGIAAPLPARASEDFPNRTVRVLIPFAPGGSSDLTGRLLAQRMSVLTGQTFVVDNRAGAGGDLAMAAGIAAPPDGHTYVIGGDPWQVRNPVLRRNIPYDIDRAMLPVARMVMLWSALAVPASLPARTLPEFIDWLRRTREPISYGTSGPGTLSQVIGHLFAQAIGVQAEAVPYRGSALALQDVAVGRLTFMVPTAGGLLPLLTGPQLRVLAVTGQRRQSIMPDVPTITEAGMPELDLNSWYGGMVPAGTPEPIIRRLAELTRAALADPEVTQRLTDQAVEPAFMPNPEFPRWIMGQRDLWRGVAARSGMAL
ncbi:MAG: tripartite tricarboxylate transporter substrate binding protein [Alphaproteobacteria bacterium]|nr:tripartite tricarboxylate transporter substrate binding protein [Alphaproteobacteria bacterium]